MKSGFHIKVYTWYLCKSSDDRLMKCCNIFRKSVRNPEYCCHIILFIIRYDSYGGTDAQSYGASQTAWFLFFE